MINFNDYTNENNTKHNPKPQYIPDHRYKILLIKGSGSWKANKLLDLMNNKSVVDKIYLYAKHPFEAKYQNLIKKRQNVGLKHYDDPKPLIEYSSDMQGFHKNIEKYNPEKKPNVLIVFDEKIADMINNKKN